VSVSVHRLVISTNAWGGGTALSVLPLSGYILEIRAPNAASQLTAGGTGDFAFTRLSDGGTVLDVTNQAAPFQYQPRPVLNTTAGGTAALPAYLNEGVPIDDHLRLTVAQAAVSTSGTVFVHVDSRD